MEMKMAKTMRTIFCLTIIFASMCSTTLYPANSEEIPLNQYGIRSTNPYVVDRFVLNGKTIDKIIVPGPPSPPPGFVRPSVANLPIPNPAAGINVLTNVPASTWAFGCSATSAAMMFGYYDNSGYTNMYAGPTNGGQYPMTNAIWGSVVINGETRALNPLSTTRNGLDGRTIYGHVDDYWIKYGSTVSDPFITGSWTEHSKGECTGDFMGTNQSSFNNSDGSATFWNYSDGTPLYDFTGAEPGNRDGCHGMKLFVELRGYAVQSSGNFNQYIYPYGSNTKGFSFADFKAEIDAGRPVLIQVEGHTMLGFGYDDTGTTVYIHDTWDYLNHTMTWGGSYSGMKHYGVSVCRLAATISGSITVSTVGGPPLAGVVMSGLTGSPTTNASGGYSGTVTSGWSGTVTPTLAGYNFSPVNRVYTSVIANQTAQDYTALPNFIISGTILVGSSPLAGVVMSGLTGSPSTSASGVYSGTVTSGWSGTVTPTLAGIIFSPVNRVYTNVTANQTAKDYTAVLIPYTISGTILVGSTPLAGVVLSGLPGNPTTNASGVYTATISSSFSGTATPTLVGYIFSPVNRVYTNITTNQTGQDYIATLSTYAISGTVLAGGSPLAGVVMSGLTGNPTTNASGFYSGTVTYNWSGTVTPTLAGYSFSPVNRAYSNVAANQTVQDYTATPITYSISGTILVGGSPLAGVVISGLTDDPVTNASGIYTATVNYNWSGTAIPTLAGYSFNPVNRVYTNVIANQTAQDYTATAIPAITVTAPNGGESWIAGTSHNITWTSTGTIANVNIDYSTNSGGSWTSVVAGTANDGTFSWTVPSTHSTTCLVRVRDAANATTMDASNTVFNILDNGTPAITVTSPNGGESWQAGTTHDITWNSSGPISAVKIELSFNGGSLWSTIIASTPNDGSYLWDIGTTPSLGCVMRISDVLGTASDTSDAMFVLTSPPSLTDNYFILPVKWTDTPFGSGGWYVGDYDGDGRSDLLRYVLDGTRNEVLLSTGSAFAAGTNWLTADHGADGWHVGDYNGDGRSDLMRYVPGVSGAQVFLSNGSNFIYNGSWTGADNGSDGWYIGDFDGDGRDDIMRYVPGVSGADVFLSDGMKFNYSGNWSGAGNGADGWYVGDFNGDGRSDLMRYYPGVSGGEVFLSDGTKFTYSGSWTGAGNGDNGWYLGKFSGTARTDIMRYVLLLSGADVFLNTGAGFTYDGSWTPAGRGDNDWHVGDFNGDGRDDLMRSIVGVTGADVLLSTTISGSSSSATPMAIQANRGKARWLNDVPAEKPLSAEEQTLLEGIKARIAAGEEVTIYQVQKEYEKLTGRLCTRAGIMKLLKQQQWDNLYKPKADDLLQ